MSDSEKPLPRPQGSPFGPGKRFEQENGESPLLADEIAIAASHGKLDEFMQKNMPDNEYAKSLTMMMMGMTGMLPPEGSHSMPKNDNEAASVDVAPSDKTIPETEVPGDAVNAIHSGDVKGLMEILEREHKKRMNDSDPSVRSEDPAPYGSQQDAQPNIEKEILDQLIKIASGNNVTLDWIVLRALKLYVKEYVKTGRL